MKKNNVIQDKSYSFALRIVKLYQFLVNERKEFVLSKQILRSGTSIGANVEEAIGGQSEKDFKSKMTIAYKEARETHYWLRLLRDSDYLSKENTKIILSDCDEILKILGSIIKTMKIRNS
ncbi:four helix bundle protein [bacterium]|nr:four helix bundle protein [bacterium]MBU1872135.1 four helix bundle protein [bacterium]